MGMTDEARTTLSGAYALTGQDACLRLYADWAKTYDQTFAAAMEYRLPAHVAAAFLAAGPPPGPVLDVGAGTGLCAQALRDQGFDGVIDGVDLSQDMLDTAATKGVYRTLHQADITRALPVTTRYGGMVSSGTFTHGHVGPQAFGPLLSLAAPGALLAFSVNLRVWDSMGFAAALAELAKQIAPPRILDVQIYGPAAQAKDPDHARDRARILLLHKR